MKLQSNTFGRTLSELQSGSTLAELSEKLTELVARVRETGKSGTLTLAVKVKPASRGGANTILVEDKVTMKLPELERAQSLFFATDDNTLQRNDPNQSELKLRIVAGGQADPETLKQANG